LVLKNIQNGRILNEGGEKSQIKNRAGRGVKGFKRKHKTLVAELIAMGGNEGFETRWKKT